MKSRILLFILALVLGTSAVQAQIEVYNISDYSSYSGCDFIMHDDAGGLVPYSASSNNLITICSPTADQMNLYFLTFTLSAGDIMTIYDGADVNAPVIGAYSGEELQFQMISSTNPVGCLTVQFVANGDANVGDFIAQGSCGIPCSYPLAAITASEPSPFLGCPGEAITFDGSSSFLPNGSTVIAHEWDFGDGTTDNVSWPTVTHQYTEPGVYHVVLTITVLSPDGSQQCTNQNIGEYYVYISTPIQWNVGVSDYDVCTGVPIYAGAANWVTSPDMNIQDSPANATFPTYIAPQGEDFGGGVYIPDNQGCFQAEITFTQFGAATITSPNDIIDITANLEHSYASDIVINIICPQGNTLQLFNGNSGGGVFLGEPIDVEDPNQPGVGYDYTWSPTGAVAFNAALSGVFAPGPLPAGTYNADGNWTALAGCTLNGTWQFQICDQVGADDGFIFSWGMAFAPQYYPSTTSFTPEALPDAQNSYWTPTDHLIFQDPNMNDVVFLSDAPGTFPITYHVTNDFGCNYDTTFNLVVYAPPTVSFVDSIAFCGSPVNLNPTYGNTLPQVTYAYSWTPATNITASNIPFPQAVNIQQSTWVGVEVWPSFDNTCVGTDSVFVWIPPTPPTAPITADSACFGENVVLFSPFTSNNYAYQWSIEGAPIPGANQSSFVVPTSSQVPLVGYNYSVTYTDVAYCNFFNSSDFTVTTLPCDVFLPNILTINASDSLNNTLNFGDALVYYQSAKVRVYNRWGDLVYENENYLNNWTPTDFAEGVYYYILNVVTPAGNTEEYPGYFHLMMP
jgi:subtilisin-like proprotein convertase family protein